MGLSATLTVVALTSLLMGLSPAGASPEASRIAERGPATLLVGTMFTLAAPLSIVSDLVRGRSPKPAACRFGHGLKMIVLGAPLLPAGLLLSPFYYERLPGGWFDGIVDSQQEDYCTRPFTTILP